MAPPRKPPPKIGDIFGKLTVLSVDYPRATCACECGRVKDYLLQNLRKGNSTSCGCSRFGKGGRQGPNPRSQIGHHPSKTRESWGNMWHRCMHPSWWKYDRYGGRGITVCDRWRDFGNFLADMGERPEGYTLSRIDHDGDYEPENCEWAPRGSH